MSHRKASRQTGMSRGERRNLITGLLFISPWIVGFCAFLAFPILASFYFSLTEFSVLQPAQFIGLENYQEMFQDEVFWTALGNTVFYAVWALPLGVIVALSLAMLLNTNVPGISLFRTIFFLPSLVPTVALAILWLWIFNGEFGILNYLLPTAIRGLVWLLWLTPILALLWMLLGLVFGKRKASSPNAGVLMGVGLIALAASVGIVLGIPQRGAPFAPPSWLGDPMWVKPAMILMSLWGVGHAMVIFLAGLQNVPSHLLEAADLDGANVGQKIRHVTIPMVSPVILFNLIMGIIGTFNFFAIPFVMAPGGHPARSAYFLSVNLYDNAYQYLRMGYASAMAWVLFIIVFLLTMAALKISENRVHYENF